jgi:hypothetical protein
MQEFLLLSKGLEDLKGALNAWLRLDGSGNLGPKLESATSKVLAFSLSVVFAIVAAVWGGYLLGFSLLK